MYTGAPDECSYHFVYGWDLVRLNPDGSCPKQTEHATFGPAADYAIFPEEETS